MYKIALLLLIGLIPFAYAENTVLLYTDKQQYDIGETVHVTGKVNFVNNKAVGIGLQPGMSVSLEVYESNRLVDVLIHNGVTDNFSFDVVLSQDGKYQLIAYYGLVNPQLRNSDYVGKVSVQVGENEITPNIPIISETKPITQPIPKQTTQKESSMDWYYIGAGIIITIGIVAGIAKSFVGKPSKPNYTTTPMKGYVSYEDNKRWEAEHGHYRETSTPVSAPRDPLQPTQSDINNNFKRYTDYEFEELIAKLFQAKGYKTELTSRSNDGGIDVWARGNGERIAIQVKKYTSNNIGRPDVAQFVGDAALLSTRLIFITTSDYAKGAREYSIQYQPKLKLWNGDKLKSEIKKYMID